MKSKVRRSIFILVLAVSILFGWLATKPLQAFKVKEEIMRKIPPALWSAHMSDEELIEEGERLFFEETFEGNGRTCGTCHPAENNLTIDPKFIATLPPNDPLFVAEFNPALRGLERPELMRQFGLILENLDGFDETDPDTPLDERTGLMRGVPHVKALRTSITPGNFSGFAAATGWSGDGAPGDGSLRQFSVGAVIQHFPKTLNREPGVDFRLPTEDELIAIEAFMLSLGRQREINLDNLLFISPIVERGKELFLDSEVGKCARCHDNAGANVSFIPGGLNFNFNTGVENQMNRDGEPDIPGKVVDPTVRLDDGFDNPGNGQFNTPSLVEAADTPPFFHNNSAPTIELAVAFFNSTAFNESDAIPIIGDIQLENTEVLEIAAFLRTINALENIENSNRLDRKAKWTGVHQGRRSIKIARSETEDAVEVLIGGEYFLYRDAVALLKKAIALEQRALKARLGFVRNRLLNKAIKKKRQAKALMVVGDEEETSD